MDFFSEYPSCGHLVAFPFPKSVAVDESFF